MSKTAAAFVTSLAKYQFIVWARRFAAVPLAFSATYTLLLPASGRVESTQAAPVCLNSSGPEGSCQPKWQGRRGSGALQTVFVAAGQCIPHAFQLIPAAVRWGS